MLSDFLSRSYDLRWIYSTDLSESDFFTLGQALGTWALEGIVYIGWDARLSTPSMKDACIQGLLTAGRTVVDLWIVSSDMLQFSTVHHRDTAALGIMITASHNPKDYTGLKCCTAHAQAVNFQKVGPELIHMIQSGSLADKRSQWLLSSENILPAWIDWLEKFCTSDASHLKVVADAGNWVAGVFMQALSERLGFTLIPLYFEPDGNFPNHHPSPIESKNTRDLVQAVKEHEADIWVAFDGDADRAVLCDSNGEIIPASITFAAITELLLTQNPWKTIIYNAVTGNIVRDTAERLGGKTQKEKVWHVYIKESCLRNPEVIFAGEHSSHYYFRELGFADSGVAAFILFLEYMAQYELSSSEVRHKFTKYASIEETNFRVTSPPEVLKAVSEVYTDHRQDLFDGLSVYLEDAWFNIRKSSNEPVIRLNIEATTSEKLKTLEQELLSHISKYSA